MSTGEKCNNKDCRIIITEHRKNGQYKNIAVLPVVV
jgi:hypothetical protein